jgi:hypothetical protein
MSKELLPVRILHDFADRAERLGVAYMLTGSLAMMQYNYYRMTADIDIIVELKYEDAERVINAFEPDYYVPHNRVKDAILRQSMFNVIHQETAYKIDMVVKKSTEYQLKSFERRSKIDFYGKDIYIITLEDLIVSKLSWAKDSLSEKQFNDIQNMLQNEYDVEYVTNWVNTLGIFHLYEKCLKEIHL